PGTIARLDGSQETARGGVPQAPTPSLCGGKDSSPPREGDPLLQPVSSLPNEPAKPSACLRVPQTHTAALGNRGERLAVGREHKIHEPFDAPQSRCAKPGSCPGRQRVAQRVGARPLLGLACGTEQEHPEDKASPSHERLQSARSPR